MTRPFSLVPMVFGDIEKEFNQLFEGNQELQVWQPKVDIINEDKHFLVKVDIPGVDPKQIDISIERNALTIRGERESEHQEKKQNVVRYERHKGSFYRQIVLPDTIDTDNITAQSNNGVLEITIPKANSNKSRKITVQS